MFLLCNNCHPGRFLLFSQWQQLEIQPQLKQVIHLSRMCSLRNNSLGKEAFGVPLVFQKCVKSFKACIAFLFTCATCLLNKSLQESIQFTGELQTRGLYPFPWTVYYIVAIHLLPQICVLADQHNSWKHMWDADCSKQILEGGEVNSSHGALFVGHKS